MPKKLISVVIPTYNEVDNVRPMTETLTELFTEKLSRYDYEILYIDNHSTDGTREALREICGADRHVKAIFNSRNFGQLRSPVHGLKQAFGDCVVRLNADFQDPPEMIPELVERWEAGHKIVIGIKNKTEEKGIMALARKLYYKLLRKISEIGHIENFTGFGLYDKAFVDVVRGIEDPVPYLRGMIAEFGFDYETVYYDRPQRRAGKTKNNFFSLYDVGMAGITSYSKILLRFSTFLGFGVGFVAVVIGLAYLILKLIFWDRFRAGMAPVLIGVFFLGAVQLFFLGLMGEYILTINARVSGRPLVVEEERLNFDEDAKIVN